LQKKNTKTWEWCRYFRRPYLSQPRPFYLACWAQKHLIDPTTHLASHVAAPQLPTRAHHSAVWGRSHISATRITNRAMLMCLQSLPRGTHTVSIIPFPQVVTRLRANLALHPLSNFAPFGDLSRYKTRRIISSLLPPSSIWLKPEHHTPS
jgi:hypothetical protein